MSAVHPTFLFDDRKRFDAQCQHDRMRSELLADVEPAKNDDPWKQRPIDFSMKNFHPNRKKEPKPFLSSSTELSTREKPTLELSRALDPTVMEPFAPPYHNLSQRSTESEDFDLDPRIRYERVKRMLNTEQYRNPQPHDYRQYPDIKQMGLPEFLTAYQRDPFNIQFLSQRLNTLWLQERAGELRPTVKETLPELYRPLSAKPKWESRLILPKLVFPNKYAAYTRYRNPTRTVQSAYWERVEDHLTQQQVLKENPDQQKKH